MDRVARLPAQQRSELFSETATQKGNTPAVVEKDFWVTWVLNRLFREPDLARLLMFKGGTSLSRVRIPPSPPDQAVDSNGKPSPANPVQPVPGRAMGHAS